MNFTIFSYAFSVLVILLLFCPQVDAQEKNWVFIDATDLTLEGKGWKDTAGPYHRLPARSKGTISDGVDGLSAHSAGMAVRFVSNSPRILVKWKLLSSSLAMEHMPATGVSSVDLYVRHKGKWNWLAIGIARGEENEALLAWNMPSNDETEYALYLPLYNGVKSVQIGVDEGSQIRPAGDRTGGNKSVVFYGSSITQGGCSSRTGMAYPAIVGRMLDIPTINLGFSGSGKAEHTMSDLLAELDPAVFVIDCLPNMQLADVDERIRYMLKVLKEKHPDTPVIMVENIIYQSMFVKSDDPAHSEPKNAAFAKIFAEEEINWNGKLYYVKCDNLTGTDGEATVDGVHMTDLGFMRFAEVLTPVIEQALGK